MHLTFGKFNLKLSVAALSFSLAQTNRAGFLKARQNPPIAAKRDRSLFNMVNPNLCGLSCFRKFTVIL
jgi:hypothetical protein